MDELERRVGRRLADLDAAGLRRSLRAPAGVDLTSNDYLQLAADPRIASCLAEAARRDGCGSTGSRLLRGERDVFARLERRFAAFKGAGRALYFSSGYLANLAVLPTLAEPGDVVYSDARNHASLIDAIRLSRAERVVVPHADVGALAREMRGHAGRGHAFVVVESLFSMDGDAAPLAEYAALCRETDATLVVDEAHAVGVFGERGSGLIEEAGLDHARLISINTAGKALGVSGAFVAGPAWAVEYLVQRARTFIFSTAAPPSLASAIDASLTIVEEEPERRARVLALARGLRDRLAAAGIPALRGSSQIVPVVVGDNERAVSVAVSLQRRGFDVRAIRPPTVAPGTARLRLSVNAGLSDALLDRLVHALGAALREADACSAVSS